MLAAASMLALTAAVPPVAAQPAAEQSQARTVDIPAGPLGASLFAVSETFGVAVLAPRELVADLSAPAVSGTMDAAEALDQVLRGSGLAASASPGGGFLIERRQAAAAPMEVADEIVVTANREYIYRAQDVQSLGFGLDQSELPVTVNVLTEDFIADTAALELTDIITYVPGATRGGDQGFFGSNFNIRGFEIQTEYINGLRRDGANSSLTTETLERVEIAKGPTGAEFGVADGGGVVNYITKKPEREFGAEIFAGVGDFGYRRFGGDVTGPIAADGDLRFRLIGAYTQVQNWRAGRPDDLPFWSINPSLAWTYMEGGEFLVEYSRAFSNRPRDRGIYYMEGAEFFTGDDNFAPRDFSVGGGDLEKREVKNNQVQVSINQKLGSVFSANVIYQYRDSFNDRREFIFPRSAGAYLEDGLTWDGATREVGVSNFSVEIESESHAVRGELGAAFDAGSLVNNVRVGIEYFDEEGRTSDADSETFGATINLFEVDNSQDPNNLGEPNLLGPFFALNQSEFLSYFGQFTSEWNERIRIIGGVRFDTFESGRSISFTDEVPTEAEQQTEVDEVSFRIAGSFDIADNVTAFVGYADSYNPQAGQIEDGSFPDPLRNASFEGGVKIELFGGGVLWSNTVYQITRDNIVAADPNDPTGMFVVPFGEVRVRGFESEFIGSITPVLDVSAGLSVQDSENIRTENPELVGNEFPNVPNFSASAFVNYAFDDFGLEGASARLGVIHVGERQGVDTEAFQLPAYTRVDVGARYDVSENLTLDLFVENLLDKTYYEASDGFRTPPVIGITPGDRRLVRFNVSYRF